MQILLVCTDAFGGHGGVAAVNRMLCHALTAAPLSAEVTVIPRLEHDPSDGIPDRVTVRADAVDGIWAYLMATGRTLVGPSPDLVLCTHIHLLPAAFTAARWHGVPLLLLIHGIEAWTPPERRGARLLSAQPDAVVGVSQYTLDRFRTWCDVPESRCHVIPNAVNLKDFGPGPKPPELLDRYGLHGRTVLFTLSRLAAEEQYKGHDEVLEVLPALVEDHPDLVYLIGGDGDDRPRLERKAEELGVRDQVIFSGYVPGGEKADHYRLADAFVMPGRGEGFGLVYLEALACGVPVVASSADASREAVRDGQLGAVVDPDDPSDVVRGVQEALTTDRETVPDGLAYFSREAFRERWQSIVRQITRSSP